MSILYKLNDSEEITDKQEKNNLVNYIYDNVDLSKFRYELLQYDTDLEKLKNGKYYISANFLGKNCLLIFTTMKNKYYQYLIDRKTLSYNKNKNDISKIYLKNVNIRIDPSIYIGSIFDGIYISNNKGKEIFIITDVYFFMGKKYIDISVDTKLFTIKEYLKTNMTKKGFGKLELSINQLYDINKLKYFVDSVISKDNSLNIKGICFYPEISGTKLIYLFDNEKPSKIISQNVPNAPNTQNAQNVENDNILKYKYIPKTKDEISAILEIKTTDLPDIYKLYAVDRILKNEKIMLKRKYVGIASIPNIQKSIWCKEIVSKSSSSVLVLCTFDKNKGKWEPQTVETDKNIPSLITDIEKEMDIIEYSGSD